MAKDCFNCNRCNNYSNSSLLLFNNLSWMIIVWLLHQVVLMPWLAH